MTTWSGKSAALHGAPDHLEVSVTTSGKKGVDLVIEISDRRRELIECWKCASLLIRFDNIVAASCLDIDAVSHSWSRVVIDDFFF
jgi:hypothetical protein